MAAAAVVISIGSLSVPASMWKLVHYSMENNGIRHFQCTLVQAHRTHMHIYTKCHVHH